jgi:3-oxoacyl-[acyl-carrier-protein] synthase-3
MAAAVRSCGAPDTWLLHQANEFMLKHLAKKADLGDVPMNIQRFGNTSCASIPLLIADPEAGVEIYNGGRVGMLGFGAGWAFAAANIDARALQVRELIEV